jgi:glycosyltransferase involved in cell wall biosynthesis
MIGISLLTLVPGALGGSETYVHGLLGALQIEHRVVAPPVVPELGTVAREYGEARTIPQRLRAMGLAAARPGPLRRYFDGVDAVHYPLTIALPRLDVPAAVTLHDLQHLDLPELFPRAERAFRAVAWHRSIRRAQIVIVPSGFVRDRLVDRLGVDPAQVRVIHHGIDHERFRPAEHRSSDPVKLTGSEEVKREPFLLYPAKTWPHKNHARLLEAFALLRRERPELRLVLSGGDRLPPQDGVEQVGRGSLDELVSLYRSASCLVFPSRYEGFGQPPLEAMACGCPVAVSNAASLPEVCGDAARYFDPESPEEIAAAVAEVLDDPEPWRARGFERAAQFTWAECARLHEDAYRELLA